jgi:hypothetical protein
MGFHVPCLMGLMAHPLFEFPFPWIENQKNPSIAFKLNKKPDLNCRARPRAVHFVLK